MNNLEMKYFILLTFILNFSAFADTVRLTNPTDFAVTAFTNTKTFPLNTDSPSGDATADTAPGRVYIPIANSVSHSEKYFYLARNNLTYDMFDPSIDSYEVRIPLSVKATQTQYIYMAAKSPNISGYKIIQRYASSISSDSDIPYFDVHPKRICDQYSTDCSQLALASTSATEVIFKTYFFLSTDGTLAIGASVDPATYTGGIYVEMPMSNRIYSSSSLIVSLSNVRKGDKRIFITYNSSATMLNFKKILVYQHDVSQTRATPPSAINEPVANYLTGTFLSKDFSTTQNGELIINDLINGYEYIFSVALMDKYGFTSTLSDYASGIPTQIEELLKKQACFILTAGFGEEHYVTNYFRKYRDEVLAHSFFGKLFIKVYYHSAPKFALFIYKHEVIRALIRGLAYCLYFGFKFGLWVLIGLCTAYYLILRKNKLILIKNRLR